MSAQAKADAEEIGRIMKEAEDKGVGEQLMAAIKALSVAPVDLVTQALGTAAPTIIGGLAGVAIRGGATAAKGISTAKAINVGLGGATGAGITKSSIYDAVESALLEAGESPEVARAKAEEAQEYTGDNWGSILAGTALGSLAAVKGIEQTLITRAAAKQAGEAAARKSATRAAFAEGLPEAAQAGQEQLAANLALQGEIDPRTNLPFDVPTFRGVAGQAALEGILGAGIGAGVEVVSRPGETPAAAQLTDEEREIADSKLSPEEQTKAQMARQKAGQQVLEGVKQEVSADLQEVDEEAEAAKAEYRKNLLKPPVVEAEPDKKKKGKGKKAKEAEAVDLLAKYESMESSAALQDIRARFDRNEISGSEATSMTEALMRRTQEGEASGQGDVRVGDEGDVQTGGLQPDAAAGVGETTTPVETGLETDTNVPDKPGDREGVEPTTVDPATLSNEELLAYINASATQPDTLKISGLSPEDLQRFIAEAKKRGLQIPDTAAPPAPEPERKIQLNEKGEVAPSKSQKAERDYLERVKTIYESERQGRTMVEETEVEDEIEGDEEAPPPKKTRKALPDWNGLTPDERQVYLDGLGDPIDPVETALTNLISYRKLKSQVTPKEEKEWPRNDAMAAYEINRVAEGKARDFAFPSWINLSEDQRNAFTSAVPRGGKKAPPPTGELIQKGFDALSKTLGPEASVGLARMQEAVSVRESGIRAKQEAAAGFRGTEDEQLSLGQTLPEDVIDIIKNPDIDGKEKTQELLKYLRTDAKGKPYVSQAGFFDKVTSQINRMVAGTLLAENLNTKIEYVDTNDFIAEYNARRDVIRVSNRGLNEVAVLHELTHAATVKTISDVLSGKEKDPAKVEAVKRLKLLMNYSKKTLGKRYNRAYENIYEFIAFGMTDPKFQAELRGITVPQEFVKYSDYKGESAWGAFVQLVADTIGLFNRFAEKVISGAPGVKSIFKLYDPGFLRGKEKQEAEPTPLDTEDLVVEPDLPPPDQSHPLIKKIDDAHEKYALIAQEIRGVTEKATKEYETEFRKAVGKDPQNKDYDNPPKDSGIVPLRKRINTETNKLRLQLNKAQTEIQSINKELRDEGLEVFEIDLTKSEADVGINKTISPGYLGNLFLEVAGIFDVIASAPPEGGIVLLENKPEKETLRISSTAPRPVPTTSAAQQAAEAKKRLIERSKELNKNSFSKFKDITFNVFTRQGYRNAVRMLQNRLVVFSDKEKELDRLGKLIMVGTDPSKRDDEINAIDTEYNRAMGVAQNFSNQFKEFTDGAVDSVRAIMKATKKSYEETLADLQMYMTGLHDTERRLELFYREVPLNPVADTQRTKIFEELHGKALSDLRKKNVKAANDIVAELKQKLVTLTTNPNNFSSTISPEQSTPGGYKYNPLGYDIDVAEKFKDTYKNASPEVKAELEKLFGTDTKPGLLKLTIDKSAEFNKRANYFTDAVENVIKFYGYKHYFPFKGKGNTDVAAKLDSVDPFISERLGGDFKQGEATFMGRQTDADNPFLQVFTEATKSSMRAGFRDVPHAMKNLINAGEVAGSKKTSVGDKGNISFAERSKIGFKWSSVAGENDFFVYKEDGSVDIYEINDPEMRRAFKGLYKGDQPLIDLANKVTSTIGSFHTRYNPAFAPLDFTRNLMTYAGIVGAKFGPKTAGQLYTAMAKVIAEGGMHKTFVFTRAFGAGDTKKLEELAKKEGYYKDVARYYELGGQVAYMDSLTNSQALESLAKELERDPRFSPKKFGVLFDSWMAMFETTSRVATFRTLKQKYKADGMKEEEAEMRAMSIAKDLANFQQVGEWGRTIGALYMFWRPAATGAVKAIDALAPALDFRSRQDIIDYYKTRPNVTDAQAQRAADVYGQEVANARKMGTLLLGAGMFMYYMAHSLAGEDDEGRNKVEIDDMSRWVRFARINLGIEVNGRDVVFQLPWGFGPGALAAAGAQVMGVAYGAQDWQRAGLNIASAAFESFMPLPVSKIDPMTNPTAFLVDSVTPSTLRPLVQFSMNTDGLGRKIYSDRQSRYADAYLGGDNVPELYRDIARGFFEATDGSVDFSPGTAYFFANNYLDGLTRALATTHNLTDVIRGQKEFDIRTDTYLLDSYFKAPSNYDAIQFSKAEKKIKDLAARMKSLEGTEGYFRFLEEYPMAPAVVDMYYTTVNGTLRELRTISNQLRRENLTQKERTELLQLYTKQQNQIKRAFINMIEGLEVGYDGYEGYTE